MAEGKYLKEQNAWLIRAAMICHVLAFVWVTADPTKMLSADRATLAKQLETFAKTTFSEDEAPVFIQTSADNHGAVVESSM